MVLAWLELQVPAQAGGGEILAVALLHPAGDAVEEQFGGIAIGIDLDQLLLIGFAPAYGPGVAVDMRHRLFRPVGLEDIITFFGREVALDHSLLVHAGHGILRPPGRGKVFEDPMRRAGEPGHGLLLFEVPIEQVADVGFRPVAGLRTGIDTAADQGGELGLIGGQRAAVNFGENAVGIFGVAARMAVAAPLHVQKVVDLLHLGF